MADKDPPPGGQVIDLFRQGNRWGAWFGSILGSPFFARVVIPVAVVLIVLKLLLSLSITYVGPNEWGIKVVRVPILGKRGVHQEVYGTGFHIVLKPFDLEEMYLFPKDLQVIYLAGAHETGDPAEGRGRPAHIQTSDGFFVDVDVSILYKIIDPYLVFTRLGTGRLFETNGIVPKAEPVLKQALGELTTEEFYVSPLRAAKAKLAKDMLNRDLATYGVQVDQLMVRYFRYSDEIQRNIEEKKLKDQLVFKNQAEGRAATEGAKLKQMIQEGEATVKIKIQEGSAYVTTKEAERDLYVRRKHADADLLIKLAEAKKTQLRNDALQGAGSDRMVGLKMAEVYRGLQLLVLPSDGAGGVNPLNLEQAMKLLEVRKESRP
jgi:regulator of protease activity HflC (stomatin/prohibitin superfamily)